MADRSSPLELQGILTSTRVGELPLVDCPALTPADTLADAARAMRTASHGCAVVCQGGKLVGIFTERDLLKAIGSGRTLDDRLADAMTANPKTVTTNDSLFEVAQSMDQGGYRRIPVVDAAGSPAGIVDTKSLVHFLVGHFPAAVYNQASHSELLTKDREGA